MNDMIHAGDTSLGFRPLQAMGIEYEQILKVISINRLDKPVYEPDLSRQ